MPNSVRILAPAAATAVRRTVEPGSHPAGAGEEQGVETPVGELIVSAANPLIKRFRALADRRHRRREGAFVVQGTQPVWQAATAGAEIETLVVAPGLVRSETVTEFVASLRARGVRVAEVGDELFRRISDRDGPSGLAAIVRTWRSDLSKLEAAAESVFVALYEVGNPGNLGTIIRTADAAGAAGVILIGHTVDPYDPVAVKASMGALFQVPIATAATVAELFDWATAQGISVATTSPYAQQTHWQADYRLPLAFLLGSEGQGLPESVLARGDLQVRIPIVGQAESLNLAVAAGILLYEARRQIST